MSTLPTIQPIPEPTLAQAPVEMLVAHLRAALPWLSHPYGLVQVGVEPKTTNKLPQLYAQDGKLESPYLYPDQNAKAVVWFEREGPSTMAWNDGLHQQGEWTHPLAAVGWLNLPAIDPNRNYDFSGELALDFLTRGLLASPLGYRITPEAIEQRQERMFARYSWPVERQQLLLWPNGGFRIPFTVTESYVACPKPFVASVELPEPLLPNVDDSTLYNLLVARGQGRPGHETNAAYNPDYQ